MSKRRLPLIARVRQRMARGGAASTLPAAIGRPIAPGHIGQALQIRHKWPPALALVLGDDLLRQLDLLLQFGDLANAELGGFDTL